MMMMSTFAFYFKSTFKTQLLFTFTWVKNYQPNRPTFTFTQVLKLNTS